MGKDGKNSKLRRPCLLRGNILVVSSFTKISIMFFAVLSTASANETEMLPTTISPDERLLDLDSFCTPVAVATYQSEVLHEQIDNSNTLLPNTTRNETAELITIAEKKWRKYYSQAHVQNLCNPNSLLECTTEQSFKLGLTDETVISYCRCNPSFSVKVNNTMCLGTLGAPCRFKNDAFLLKPRECDSTAYQCEDIKSSSDSIDILKNVLAQRHAPFAQIYLMEKTTHICHCKKGIPSVAGICIGDTPRGNTGSFANPEKLRVFLLFCVILMLEMSAIKC